MKSQAIGNWFNLQPHSLPGGWGWGQGNRDGGGTESSKFLYLVVSPDNQTLSSHAFQSHLININSDVVERGVYEY